MTQYNCKDEGDEYRITKFDEDMNVEASYLTSLRECDCPAGHRDTCRHRKMLPKFIKAKATRGQMFLNYETGTWDEAEAEVEFEPTIEFAPMVDAPAPPDINLLDLAKIPGVTVIDLETTSPGELWNIIAEAVGEPTVPVKPKPLRRL